MLRNCSENACDQVLYYCSLKCIYSAAIVEQCKIHIAVEEITEDRKVRNLFNYVCQITQEVT